MIVAVLRISRSWHLGALAPGRGLRSCGCRRCALPHINTEMADARSQRSEGKPITRGDTAMTKFFRSADDAEIYVLEHRFPFATTLISIFLAGIVVSAIMMLIAQN